MKARIRADLTQALKDKRRDEAGVLRTLIAALDNAEAPEVAHHQASAPPLAFGSDGTEVTRLALDAGQIRAIVVREADERRQAADTYAQHGQTERAERLQADAAIIRTYLDWDGLA